MLATSFLLWGSALLFRQQAPAVTLGLQPATTTIRAYDPLPLKAVIHNPTIDDFVIPPLRRDLKEWVVLQYKKPDDKDYQRAPCEMGSLLSSDGGNQLSLNIPAKTNYASYETLYGSLDKPVFDQPGEYEIRMELRRKGQVSHSTPIRVKVRPISPEQLELLRKRGRQFERDDHWTPILEPTLQNLHKGGGIPPEFVPLMARLEEELTECQTKAILRWQVELSRLISLGIGSGPLPDYWRWLRTRDALDPISREVADLALARYYTIIGAAESAAALIAPLQERSQAKTSIENRIQGILGARQRQGK